jgi:hypothetical protein
MDMQGKAFDLQVKQQTAQLDLSKMAAQAELKAAMPPVTA